MSWPEQLVGMLAAFEGIEASDYPVRSNCDDDDDNAAEEKADETGDGAVEAKAHASDGGVSDVSDASTSQQHYSSGPNSPVLTNMLSSGAASKEADSEVVFSGGTRQEREQLARALEESFAMSQQTQLSLTQAPATPVQDGDDDFPTIVSMSGSKTVYDRGVYCAVPGGCKHSSLPETYNCSHTGCHRQVHNVCYSDYTAIMARRGIRIEMEKPFCKFHVKS